MGEIEREYIRHGHESMLGPLQRFLEGEMKNITRERKILENKRLDLVIDFMQERNHFSRIYTILHSEEITHWLNYLHSLIRKDTSGFTSNTIKCVKFEIKP